MKILFRSVGRVDDAIYEVLEMPVVPRVDDTIQFEFDLGPSYEVYRVTWCPNNSDYQAYVVLR